MTMTRRTERDRNDQASRARAARLALVCVAAAGLTLGGVPRAAQAERWTRKYIDSLPDSAFAVVESQPDGTKVRHLPHHDRSGRVDLPHVRNALGRLSQVKWTDARNAAVAREHLNAHARAAPETDREQR